MEEIKYPLPKRTVKPRQRGLTMVIDKGLGINAYKDLLNLAGEKIDFLKLGFGTAAFYPLNILQDKIFLAKEKKIDVYFGGTFLEIIIWQNKLNEYLSWLKELGIDVVEVSDGTIYLSEAKRALVIKKAQKMGFKVLSEVGKKNIKDERDISYRIKQIKNDLTLGVCKVIVEGRESGKGVGFYDNSGRIKPDDLQELTAAGINTDNLIFEAPLKNQQTELITLFGNNVNLGNILPDEVLALEALRLGLRGDTFRLALEEEKNEDRDLCSARGGWRA